MTTKYIPPNPCKRKKESLHLQKIQSCNNYKSMKTKTQTVLKALTQHGIKASPQRLAVMQYLMDHRTHPTVEEIYKELHPLIPTLSKTTVYNTLKLLVEEGAALQLTIDEKKTCYDADTAPHAHFLCSECGKVYDVPLTNPRLEDDAQMPEGFQCEQADLYFRGICQKCAH